MAFYHPDPDNSSTPGVVSVRSTMPTSDPSTHDDQFVDQNPNNHILHPEMKTKQDVIVEVLKGHPIFATVTEATQVPLLYVQQF